MISKKSFSDIKLLLNKDVKEFNKIILSLVCVFILCIAGFISYFITNSYALFIDVIEGKKNISVSARLPLDTSGANAPELYDGMIPVYYDSTKNVWKKADSNNSNPDYQWYDYDSKMWANSVTYNHDLVYDESSKEQHGDIVGAQYTDDGMSFDGDDYVNTGNPNYDFGNKLTVGARFKINKFGITRGSGLVDSFGSNKGFEFFVDETSKIVFQFWTASDGTRVEVSSLTSVNLNEWYTVVVTYDGSVVNIYINGVLDTSYDVSGSISVSSKDIVLGANALFNEDSFFNGVISDVFLINDVLVSSVIIENYNETNFNYVNNINTLFHYILRNYESRSLGALIPMDVINTIQVWIPRYKYTVWNYNLDGTKFSEPQAINIKFEKGNSSTGELVCNDLISGAADSVSEVCRIKGSNLTCTDETCNGKTYTHPAFTLGNKELDGFWVAKFEVSPDISCTPNDYDDVGSGCNLVTINPRSKPNTLIWRGAMISLYQNNFFAMNDENNVYGLGSKSDPHVVKSSEWGAIAYLSHSKYGINGQIGLNSNNTNLTGCGPQASGSTASGSLCNSYETTLGKSASTTGNIYGVYDMVGGLSEYTMANIVSTDGVSMLSGNSFTNNEYSGYNGILYASGNFTPFSLGEFNYPNRKYYDRYSYNTSSNNDKLSKLGDGLKEVLSATNYSWYATSNSTYLPINTNPWWPRGSAHNSANITIFSAGNTVGTSSLTRTSRFIIS